MPVILAKRSAEDDMPPLPEGLLIELVTPLTPVGVLDRASLARLVEHVSPWAAALVAGTPGLGEALELPPLVRQELFTALLESKPPTLPLFFGVTGGSLDETLALAQQLERLLAPEAARDIFWLDLPLWWHSNRGLPQAYAQLSASLARPLVLLNQPHLIRGLAKPLKHLNIRTAVLKKLTNLAGVAGLVYHGELRRFLHYYAAAAARPDFMLYEGDERRFLTRPGARGVVSAGGQLLPQVWHQVAQACLFPSQGNGQGEAAAALLAMSRQLLALHDCYHLQPASLLKQGLHQLGILAHPTVWPATPAAPAHLLEQFRQILAQTSALSEGMTPSTSRVSS